MMTNHTFASLMKKRLIYLFCICLLTFLGLSSRSVSFLPSQTGDALWAMTLFCFLRFLFINKKLSTVAWVSLIIAFLDEFAQLIQWPWLVDVRSTWLGHMILGQGFLWQDLVAYMVGIGVMYVVCKRLLKD